MDFLMEDDDYKAVLVYLLFQGISGFLLNLQPFAKSIRQT